MNIEEFERQRLEDERLKEDERNWDVHGIPKIILSVHEEEDIDTHIRPLDESDMN